MNRDEDILSECQRKIKLVRKSEMRQIERERQRFIVVPI